MYTVNEEPNCCFVVAWSVFICICLLHSMHTGGYSIYILARAMHEGRTKSYQSNHQADRTEDRRKKPFYSIISCSYRKDRVQQLYIFTFFQKKQSKQALLTNEHRLNYFYIIYRSISITLCQGKNNII